MRPAAALLIVPLLVAAAALASVQQDVAVGPRSAAPPATLDGTTNGTTVIGSSGTSATTDLATLLLTAQDILDLDQSSEDWQVHLELDSASGFGVLDSVTVSLTDGITIEPQVDVLLGSVTQTSGTALSLTGLSPELQITVLGTKVSGGTSTLDMQVVLIHDAAAMTLHYAYVLDLV